MPKRGRTQAWNTSAMRNTRAMFIHKPTRAIVGAGTRREEKTTALGGVATGSMKADEAAIVATPETILEIARIPEEARSESQSAKIHRHFMRAEAPEAPREAFRQLARLTKERYAWVAEIEEAQESTK